MRRSLPILLALPLAIGACPSPSLLHLGWEDGPDRAMTITWRADAQEGVCAHGPTENLGETQGSDPVPFDGGWLHHVTLTGLDPGTTYHYRCGTPEEELAPHTFTTAVPPGEAFAFVAWGDSRSDAEARRRVRAAVEARAPAFSVFTGDLVANGYRAGQWDAWFSDMEPLVAVSPLLPALGNHEKGSRHYFTRFVLPRGAQGVEGYEPEAFYSFDYGNVHFLALSTEPLGEVGGPQYRWAERDLAAARANPDIDFVVVYGHRPPYSSGRHGSALDVRAWMPLLEAHGVDVAFWGHDHHYERTVPIRGGVEDPHGIVHVITGGAGAPLRDVEPGALTAAARRAHHFVEVQVAPGSLTLLARDAEGAVFDRVRILSEAQGP